MPPYTAWYPTTHSEPEEVLPWYRRLWRQLFGGGDSDTDAAGAAGAEGETVLFVYGTLKVPPHTLFYSQLSHIYNICHLGPNARTMQSEPGLTRVCWVVCSQEGFHWNSKFLAHCSKEGTATTQEPYPLVVGESGVPYLLGDTPGTGEGIVGELWRVSAEALEGLDEHEGIQKGHYERRCISVVRHGDNTVVSADVYFKVNSSAELRACEQHPEYTMEMHKELYCPIRHIEVKQQLYLGDVISASNET